MNKAIVNNGVVANIAFVEEGSSWVPPEGTTAIDAGDAAIGDLWDGKTFSRPTKVETPLRYKVSTYRILRRLEDAGLIDKADAALNANRTLFRRFYTVGSVYADEPDARAFLTALGADADAVLAPEN